MNLEKSSEYFFNQNSIDSNNLDFLDEKISDFISNPSITTESIHNFFSQNMNNDNVLRHLHSCSNHKIH